MIPQYWFKLIIYLLQKKESLAKSLERRIQDHNRHFHNEVTNNNSSVQSSQNAGLGFVGPDEFLLLSTGRQNIDIPGVAICGAGGRLLVGYNTDTISNGNSTGAGSDLSSSSTTPGGKNIQGDPQHIYIQHHVSQQHNNNDRFDRVLKKLKASSYLTDSSNNIIHPPGASAVGGQQRKKTKIFPEDGGGAKGLNVSLSTGFSLLSRYRLRHRSTENFGMGRLPSSAMVGFADSQQQSPNNNLTNTIMSNALQPACLILLTDGECLTKPKRDGGGALQLNFGNMPLREFYAEPFRWDQRFFCINIGKTNNSMENKGTIHPSLRALCEVTGGGHVSINSTDQLSHITDSLLRKIAPVRPKNSPIADPLKNSPTSVDTPPFFNDARQLFVNGGPVCSFQTLELESNGEPGHVYKAMLLHVPYKFPEFNPSSSSTTSTLVTSSPPIWCIPEHFFPNKKLDSLPPRSAQPLLNFTRHFQQVIGPNIFDPNSVMKSLNKLDQLTIFNKQHAASNNNNNKSLSSTSLIRLLQRDVYICNWVNRCDASSKLSSVPWSKPGFEHYPICVRGAVRPSLTQGNEDNFLNVGILHIPSNQKNVSDLGDNDKEAPTFSTLTLLPPEIHILLPLLLRAAEMEHRIVKKVLDSNRNNNKDDANNDIGTAIQAATRNIMMDEHWRTEFRAYLFRLPPHYQSPLRRCLRPLLPASVHALLGNDGIEAIASQSFSRLCLQKIRSGEQISRENNERLERQEEELFRKGVQTISQQQPGQENNIEIQQLEQQYIPEGQYDPRLGKSNFFASLRSMNRPKMIKDNNENNVQKPATQVLGDLPADCLLAYYESRRKWIFGGVSLTTKGKCLLHRCKFSLCELH